jgi:hypothetical protein
MATRLKTWHPDVQFSGAKVGADEVDFYHTYTIPNLSIGTNVVATAKSIAVAVALTVNTEDVMDVPRNLVVRCPGGTSNGTYGGTTVINGLDQFGNAISETISIATAVNGGTGIGTKVFAKFTSGTATLSGDTALATVSVGYGTAGTTTLFGLPFKVGGTADLMSLSWASAHALQVILSGAVGSYLDVNQHAIIARTDFGTASGFVAWLKSTKDQSNDTTSVVGR